MTYDNIFAAAAEIYDERAGICIESGIDKETAEEIAANEALAYIEKHRGQPASDRLRTDALNALKEK